MSKSNPWFKFYPDTWLAGTVSFLTDDDQIFFLHLLCLIWKNNGAVKIDDRLMMRCSRYADACDRIDRLVKSGILQKKENVLSVLFLSEQLYDIGSRSKQAKAAADARWANSADTEISAADVCDRMQSALLPALRTALPIDIDTDKEEEKEADGEREKKGNKKAEKKEDPDSKHFQIIYAAIQPFISEFEQLPDEEFLRFCKHWSGLDMKTNKRMYLRKQTFNARTHLSVWVINWEKDPDFWTNASNKAEDLFDKAMDNYNQNEGIEK